MNDTKELKSEYVALGRGSWEGITNSSLLQAARCGLRSRTQGRAPENRLSPGVSAHWSPAAAGASLQPSSRSSWPLTSHPSNREAARCPQRKPGPRRWEKHPHQLLATLPASERAVPAAGKVAQPEKFREVGSRGRPSSQPRRRQAEEAGGLGGRRPPGRLRGARTGSAGRMEEGRRAGEVGGGPSPGSSPPRARDPRSPPTPRALRVRRRSPEEEPPSRSRRLGRAIRQLCARNASHPATRRGRQKCQAMTGEEG